MTRPAWRELLTRENPLLLPVAHDALSARLVERAGFSAYAIGGFPLVGSRHALPDIGLVGLGEMSAGMRDIIAASQVPVLVDGDDGYGDVKNVTRTIRTYEQLGAAAILLEDQVASRATGCALPIISR
jgi:2-methylisocitrate lyase-like PEP mutase family enzyme